MKRKVLLICAGAALLLAIILGLLWWRLPVVFLEDVDPASIARIEVFNGASGHRFTIENDADISHIVTNIQRTKMYKKEWEEKDGFVYSLSFYAADGSRIAGFLLNGSDTVRDGNMEYECESDALCFAYIRNIEAGQ